MAIKWSRKNKTKKANTASIDSKSTPEAKRISNTLDDTIIASDNYKRTKILKAASKHKKPLVAVIALVLVVGVLGGAIWVRQQNNRLTDTCGSKRSTLYEGSATAIAYSDYRQLELYVDKIENQEEYEQDPNCLYPIVAYNILVNDIDKAEAAFEKLEKVYDSGDGFADSYKAIDKGNLDVVRKDLQAAKDRIKKLNENTFFFN